MTTRIDITDGTETGSYSRAVRVGDTVHVSGTTSLDGKGGYEGDDVGAQTAAVYRKIEAALIGCDATMDDIVRITAYTTDMDQSAAFLEAHSAAMGGNKPAAALIGVSSLIDPGLLIDIEAYAVVGAKRHAN
jgi:enamine deaminase RidA (YjgF/YER057c/UK114 family)